MEWNEETIGRLRTLWAEGHSTAEIGRRMSVSKNAVVGKAHRLGLAARPSPIRRDPDGAATPRPPAPRRMLGPTLPPLVADPPAPALAEAAPRLHLTRPEPEAEAPPAMAEAPPAQPTLVRVLPSPRIGRHTACCWPIGEPGTRSFRFCDLEAVAGKPYCTEHVQLAYVKVRDRREDAAA